MHHSSGKVIAATFMIQASDYGAARPTINGDRLAAIIKVNKTIEQLRIAPPKRCDTRGVRRGCSIKS